MYPLAPVGAASDCSNHSPGKERGPQDDSAVEQMLKDQHESNSRATHRRT
jgi:hypothetical protein